MKNSHKIWSQNLKTSYHLGDIGTYWKIILKNNLGYSMLGYGLRSSGSGLGLVMGACEHNNVSRFQKVEKYLSIEQFVSFCRRTLIHKLSYLKMLFKGI
jgi:hypothetical protein